MGKVANPPWLMWGQSQNVAVQGSTGVVSQNFTGQQGVAIDYGRPDSWRFIFHCRVMGGAVGGGGGTLTISYDVTIGVGRGQITMPDFVTFAFNLPAGPLPAADKWTNTSQPPALSDVAPLVVAAPIDVVCAQTIITSNRIRYQPFLAPTDLINLQIDTFFAPSTHVRPEWYGKDALGSMDR